MKILLVSDYYPPFLGGAQRQVHLMAKELSARGHDVSVATLWHPGMDYHKKEDFGVSVFRIKQIRTLFSKHIDENEEQHQPPFPDPVSVYGLRRLINRINPDIVHSYGWITSSCAIALLGKKIPLIVSSRDYGYSCATRELLYRGEICDGPGVKKCFQCSKQYFGLFKGTAAYISIYFGRSFLLNRVRGIHSVSAYVRDINRRDWVNKRNSKLASNGGKILECVVPGFLIDAAPRPDDNDILEQLPDEPYILFVGGLQPRKGLKPLLDAYKLLESPPPLVLIGYVVPDAPKSFPETVRVVQNVPHGQVITAWKHCLFGVTPSLWADPSPGVTKEAMSQGKAVIGTSVGGITEMITDGETGFLVPPNDIQALAKAMQRLIDDDSLREKMGIAAQERAKQYTSQYAISEIEVFYQRVLDSLQ